MNPAFILVPLLTAFTGWFAIWLPAKMLFHPYEPRRIFGFSVQGIFPKNQISMAKSVAATVTREFLSFEGIEQKITDPANFEKIVPHIEIHIDEFLNKKLKQSMPVIGMFIGEKTITQLKTVFLEELRTLFPIIMKNYVQQLKTNIDIERMIIEKITSIIPAKAEIFFHEKFSKELRTVKIFGAAIGFIIGIIQALILFFL